MDDFQQLRILSADLGADELLVQAGGGNTSVKTEAGLWIKASGTRLADAMHRNIFLLLPWSRLEDWQRGSEDALTVQTEDGKSVRASVETAMHVVLPHRFVAHTHSVRGISWLVQPDSTEELERRLDGLRWVSIPYIHPGRTLADFIRGIIEGKQIDILLLENHGLVVGADSAAELMDRLRALETRLDFPARNVIHKGSGEEDLPGWIAVPGAASAMAMDTDSMRIAGGGTLYPDHCVYLGPGIAVAKGPSDVPDALRAYELRHGLAARAILAGKMGAYVRAGASPECAVMLRCLGNIVSRIPNGVRIRYLSEASVELLRNWDAEAYRLKIASEQALQPSE